MTSVVTLSAFSVMAPLAMLPAATQFSVEHTTRDAADIGYRVRLFADCCASGDIEAHRASLRTLRLLAEVVSSEVAFSE